MKLFEKNLVTKLGKDVRIRVIEEDGRHPDLIAKDPKHPIMDTIVSIQIKLDDGTWYDELLFIPEYLTKGELRKHFKLE